MSSRIPRRASRYTTVPLIRDDISKAIFGSFDGVTCVLGVVAAGVVTGDIHALVLAAIGLAIAEGIAMSGGSYLSELTSVNSVKHAAIIGGAAFIGVVLPVLPFLFLHGLIAVVVSGLVTCTLAVLIAQVRASDGKWLQAYVQTFVILLVAAGASVAITLLLNRVGA